MTPGLAATARPSARSAALMARARELFPGGVNSPVRAFGGVGGEPIVVARGQGARIWDVDDNEYLDYVLSWGPLVLGHAAPVVLDALRDAMSRGTSFGIPTGLEITLAELVQQRMPHVEMMRFVSSGTEATMSALRLARAATGRDLLLKFDGCYHGHGDSFLVRAGSGVATLGLPNSPGVPDALAALTLTAPYNDVAATEAMMRQHGDRIAAIFVEPIVGNAGFIAPDAAFLPALRRLATEHGALLVFDEVMTGFRVAPGGAAERFGITPDLTTLGKVIGGGMPVGAFGGRRAIMEKIAPLGPVYQAGTLSGNPVAVAAGLATLRLIEDQTFFDTLTVTTRGLVDGLCARARAAGVPFAGASVGGMFGIYFAEAVPKTYAEVTRCDVKRFGSFFHRMLDAGIYLAPSAFEAGFVSAAHSQVDIDATIAAAGAAFAGLD